MNNFKSAINAGMIVDDADLRKWGLHAKNNLGFEDTRFKAFNWWVWRFKQTHQITSRKDNQFITRKTLGDMKKLKVNAENFVNEVKPYITQYGTEDVYNSDQSGFQLETYSGICILSLCGFLCLFLSHIIYMTFFHLPSNICLLSI